MIPDQEVPEKEWQFTAVFFPISGYEFPMNSIFLDRAPAQVGNFSFSSPASGHMVFPNFPFH